MVDSKIEIQDTGKNTTSGSAVYTQVDSGNWITLHGFNFTGSFTATSTNNVSFQEADDSNLTFKSNEIAALQAPRLTLRGLVPASETTKIANVIALQRSKGLKSLKGGLGLIDALPEAEGTSPKNIYVIVKNVDFAEVYANDKSNINFTIQLEQVK